MNIDTPFWRIFSLIFFSRGEIDAEESGFAIGQRRDMTLNKLIELFIEAAVTNRCTNQDFFIIRQRYLMDLMQILDVAIVLRHLLSDTFDNFPRLAFLA
ncbi:Uncharacterised protein [Vibrio cholerae]|nr:Uncharacterised protein [Vibrio cholerae]